MALPLIGLTVLTGYLLSNNDESENKPKCTPIQPRNSVIPNDLPNGKNIYTSNYSHEADYAVLQKSIQNYKDAEDPVITGMLPPLFNTYSMNGNVDVLTQQQASKYPTNTLSSVQMNNLNEINKRVNVVKTNDKNISVSKRPMFNPILSSNAIPKDYQGDSFSATKEASLVNPLTGVPYESVHKNMVPFFGGSVKQNIEKLTNVTRLDLYTGNNDTFKHKKEIAPLYTLQKQDIHGTPIITENTDMSRFIPSNYKQNEKPFYEEKVSAPIAGTVYNNIRTVAKTVDELRYASKPKLSFEGRTIAGQFGNVRGQQAKVEKNLVDTYYENTPDRWLKTKSVLTGETARENYDMKKTTRQDTSSESYYGPSYAASYNKTSQRTIRADDVCKSNIQESIVQETNRQSFKNDFVRNVDSVKKSDVTDDFGKKGYNPKITERFVNGETNQFNLNVNMQTRGQQLKYSDNAKTTIKQSTLHSNIGNIKSIFDKSSMNAVDECIQKWEAKATQKQALVNNKYVGNATKDKGMGYNIANYDARTTGKEIITANSNYIGGSSAHHKNNISRNNYENAEIDDRQEILISNERSSGPQSFQISAGADIQGELKYTNRMALKEEFDYRRQQDQKEFLNTNSPRLTVPLQNLGVFENKAQTYSEEENTRIDPILNNQLCNNPFYINTQGKI